MFILGGDKTKDLAAFAEIAGIPFDVIESK